MLNKTGLAVLTLPIVFFSFIFPSDALAAFSFQITNIDPDSVSTTEDEVTVSVLINDLPSESYFRAEWQQSAGSTYFGYSKNNNGEWVKVEASQNCANYFRISDIATTSAILKTKMGNDNNPANGSYSLKVRRYYASSCNVDRDSDPISIAINLPTPTPTPTPTSTPTPVSTVTPTPTITAVPTATPIKTLTPTAKPTLKAVPQTSEPQVLAARKELEATPNPTSTPNSKSDNGKKVPVGAVAAIAGGVGFIGVATLPFIRMRLKGYNLGHESRKSEEVGKLH